MRNFIKPLVVLILVSMSTAFSQDRSDPFGGPGADPFGVEDPFAAKQPKAKVGKARTEKQSATQSGASRSKTATTKTAHQRDSSAAATIREILGTNTTFTFVETPLEEAIIQLSQMHDVPVVIDRRSLEEVGLSAEEPVSLDLRNVSLRSALRLILRELDLTYLVKDEVLQIMTLETAEQNPVLEMYVIPEVLNPKADQVLSVLMSTVNPEEWTASGGVCTASVIDNVLVISAPERIHENVIEYLQKLQVAFERPANSK